MLLLGAKERKKESLPHARSIDMTTTSCPPNLDLVPSPIICRARSYFRHDICLTAFRIWTTAYSASLLSSECALPLLTIFLPEDKEREREEL
jgi:hypothetical protein